jgi:hypothetical protein
MKINTDKKKVDNAKFFNSGSKFFGSLLLMTTFMCHAKGRIISKGSQKYLSSAV